MLSTSLMCKEHEIMSERIVHVIPNLQMKKYEQKAVGIYARVSTVHSAQLHSVSLQLSALVQRVYHTLNWQLADIYVDFASGKSASERTEFQRMIEDCRRHKLDLILVKSVSRFSRDTVDALETTRELKRLGIPVYFDLESINSFQPDFELYYSVCAAVAQSERESNHDNLAISIQHKIKDGTSKLYSRPCYGYKLDRNGEFVIVQEEAEVVKLVFNLYLDGLSILGIMRELEQRGITSPSGKAKWCRRSIDLMLENEKYRGNSVATAPTMSDAPKDLPRRRYMLSMHHEGIISSEQFDDVQKEKERRSNIEFDENGTHRKKTQYRAKLKISEDGSISIEQEPD